MSSSTKTLAVFPGQGSQFVGMAKTLVDDFTLAREIFEEASESIKTNLKKLCFDGPESDLTLTENTQPCLLVASVATFRVLAKETGFKPDGVAGHSLGEYSALVAAGAFPLGLATQWVRERGRAMQQAVPAGQGKMAAIMGLEDAVVTALCTEATTAAQARRASAGSGDYTVECIVEPANFNSPGQVVIAGSGDAVEQALETLKSGGNYAGGKGVLLNVSAPFHCRLMAPARKRMHELFAASASLVQSPLFPYIPNTTARIHAEKGVILSLLEEQVDHPVLWKQTVEHAITQGFSRFVECGPNKVLSGLIKRIAQKSGAQTTLLSVSDTAGIKAFLN